MASINEVVCKVLQLTCEPAKLNYYSMLQLSDGTSEKSEISQALQVAVTKLRFASKSESPETIEAVKKLLQQANSVLLNPEKKTVYDNQLLRQRSKVPAAETAAPPVQSVVKNKTSPTKPSTKKPIEQDDAPKVSQAAKADPLAAPIVVEQIDPLAGYLPAGDPHAEFSLRDYLNTAPAIPPIEPAESRLADLEALRNGFTPSNIATNAASPSMTNAVRNPAGNRAGTSIHERIRRKRALQNTLMVGGLSALSIGLIAFAVYQFMYRNKGKQVAQNTPTVTNLQEVSTTEAPDASVPNEVDPAKEPDKKSNRSETPFELPDMSKKFGEGTQSFFSDDKSDSSKDGAMNGMDKKPTEMSDAPVEMMQSDFDQAAWDKLVDETRKSIASKDFEKFNQQMNELFAVQTTDAKLIAVRDAIDRTGQVYRFGSEAFESAVESLESGVALETDKQIINFVERKENELIFRVSGKNTTYDLSALPVDVLSQY